MSELVRNLLRNYIKRIEIDSNLMSEPWVFNDPFAPSPPGTSDQVMALAQPSITVVLEGEQKYTIAPAGKPSRKGQVEGIKAGTAVVVGLGGLLAVALMLGRRK